MDQNTIRVIIIVLILVLIRMIIKNVKNLKKSSFTKSSEENLEELNSLSKQHDEVHLNLFGVKVEIEVEKDVEDSYIEKCVAHLNNLDDKVIDELCRKLAVNYTLVLKSVKDYGTSEEIEEFENQIPNKFVNREILKYITPQIIYIEPPLEDIPAYTLYCECVWEEEHGVNLIFKGDNILYFGDACCTIGPWADDENYKYELGFLKDYLNDNNLVIENLNDIFTKLSKNYKVEWIKKSKNQFYLYFSKDKKDYRIYVSESEINISEMKKQSWEKLENTNFENTIYKFLELYIGITNYIQEYNNK